MDSRTSEAERKADVAKPTGVLATTQPEGDGLSHEYIKDTYQIKHNGACLSIQDGKNDDEKVAVYKTCNPADKSQAWYPWYRYQAPGPHWNRLQNQ